MHDALAAVHTRHAACCCWVVVVVVLVINLTHGVVSRCGILPQWATPPGPPLAPLLRRHGTDQKTVAGGKGHERNHSRLSSRDVRRR